MSFFANILGSIDLGSNWFLIFLFLAIGFGYGLALGKNRLNLIALAAYFSLLITSFIPWKQLGFLGVSSVPDANVLIFLFLALILAIFFLAPYSGFASVVRLSGRGRASFWQLWVLGIFQIGFILSAAISFMSDKALSDLSPILKDFFAAPLARFVWLLLPLVAMFALKRRRTYSYRDEE